MATKISAFEPVLDIPGFFTATKNNLRCTAIKLRSGGLCLFSPVSGLSDAAKDSLEEIGEVEFLFAPNSYHNGGLVEYSTAYPSASLVASPDASDRLQERTSLAFNGLDALSEALPRGMRLESPAGLKNGETWLIASTDSGWLWHVVDAFAAQKNTEGKVGNWVRANKVFPSFAIKDRGTYVANARELLVSSPPNLLLPCHGAIVQADDIIEQMEEILTSIAAK